MDVSMGPKIGANLSSAMILQLGIGGEQCCGERMRKEALRLYEGCKRADGSHILDDR